MEPLKINFLPNLKKRGDKKKISKLFFYPLIFIIIFIAVFSFQIILSGDSLMESIEKINIFQNYGLTFSQNKYLLGEAEDRINILLLGMGGLGHPGPFLTDTMILVSIKPSENKVAMVSIPRDLSVPMPGYGWRKINFANHYGEAKDPGNGSKFAAEVVAKTFNLPIHYYIRLDFSGFETLIDELGGIKIHVDNSFIDYQFPTDNFGYQTVSFQEGWQKMDGETALNYARSRHGTNGENSDFARSKRQHKVLEALKDKALSFSTFLSYKKISALMDLYQENVSTNMQVWEIFEFLKIAKKIEKENINNIVLDNRPGSPLYSTIINEAYLLLPKDMTFYELQQIVKYAFEPEKEIKPKEQVKVEIQNGTRIEGLAYRTSVDLKNKGYKVVKIGNATVQNYEKTVIYDLTQGKKEGILEELVSNLGANVSTNNQTAPKTISDIDFLIILGPDQ
ncbi:MAG TPA: LytR family transcriptional regulator [Candidatus Uhrbacteria bacterium]|nr:LytR family transcriptional regulator [Candidatus Uhrbacteria bacterium]